MQICQNFTDNKNESMQKTHRNAISNKKKSTLSISTILSGVILHARLFVTGQLRNPWVPRNPGWKTMSYANKNRTFQNPDEKFSTIFCSPRMFKYNVL